MVRKLRPRFNKAFVRKFFVRFHMGLILFAVAASGFICDLILLRWGVSTPAWRYLFSISFAYAALFGFVRLWLSYIYPRSPNGEKLDYIDWTPSNIPASSDSAGSVFQGAGGRSGGGGASADWGEFGPSLEIGEAPGLEAATEAGASGAKEVGSAVGAAFDLDALPIIGLIAFVGMIVAVLGSAVYLIVDAPAVLAEAALQMGLSLGLIRLKRKRLQGNWIVAIARSTWKSFALTTALLLLVGVLMGIFFPTANTLPEVLRQAGWLAP